MRMRGITRRKVTISLDNENWQIMRKNKMKISTIINELVDNYLKEHKNEIK